MVKLAALKAGGPFTLTIEGKNKVEVADVLVGEVWICSGQSNMEWTLARAAEAEAATRPRPTTRMLRLYTVPKAVSDEPLATIKRKESPGQRAWLASDPESAAKFSAVGYFFGRDLRKALGVPVGLIHTSWGGTAAEAWTVAAALEADPAFKTLLDDYAEGPRPLSRGDGEVQGRPGRVPQDGRRGQGRGQDRPDRPQGPGRAQHAARRRASTTR